MPEIGASRPFNSHHRRAWKNAHGAMSNLGKIITDLEDEPSNSSQEMNDKFTQAYIMVQDALKELEERRTADKTNKQLQRQAMKEAPTLP